MSDFKTAGNLILQLFFFFCFLSKEDTVKSLENILTYSMVLSPS